MNGPETWSDWLSSSHLLGRLVVASVELAILAVVLAAIVRCLRKPPGRLLACAWGVVLLKPLATLVLGSPVPLLRIHETRVEPKLAIAGGPAPGAGALASGIERVAEGGELPSVGAESAVEARSREDSPLDADQSPAMAREHRDLDARSLLLGAWALGVIVLAARAWRSHVALRRLVRSSEELPPSIRATWTALSRDRLPWRRVEARVTHELESPSLAGIVRSTVLLPTWLVESDRTDLVTWAVKHELAHARWFDPLAIALRDIVSVLFFFHPLLPWIRRSHSDAMESACDWEAVRDPVEAVSYAEGLGTILSSMRARRTRGSPAEALAMVARGNASRRVEALLDGRRPRTMTTWSSLVLVVATCVVLTFGCGATRETNDGAGRRVEGSRPTAGATPRPGDPSTPPATPSNGTSSSGTTDSAKSPHAPEIARVEAAVIAGLHWLARHQDEDGAWRPTSVAKTCAGLGSFLDPTVPYTTNYDTGVTGMVLQCFLDAGFTPESVDEWVDPVTDRRSRVADVARKAIDRLVADAQPDGASSPRRPFMYNEALAATALAKACRASSDTRLRETAQRAVTFVQSAQRPAPWGNGLWGWRYASRREVEAITVKNPDANRALRELVDSDTSITGWCVEVLAVAATVGLDVKRENLDGALAFTKWVSNSDGRVGYLDPRGAGATVTGPGDHFVYHPAAMSALGILTRSRAGGPRDDPFLMLAAKHIVADVPRISDDRLSIDYYYWRVGLLALAEVDGPRAQGRTGAQWNAWSAAAVESLLELQDHDSAPCTNGAWMVADRWSYSAGALYTTSMNVSTLIAYLRATATPDSTWAK